MRDYTIYLKETIEKVDYFRTLEKVYNSSVTDRQAQDDLKMKKMKELVQKIDKSLLTDITKVWMYQNLLLAMIGWPLMIYETSLSWVKSVETHLNGCLCKWLSVTKNMSNMSLYCDETVTPYSLPTHRLETDSRSLFLEDCCNSNSQLETKSYNCTQVRSGKLQLKQKVKTQE